MYLYHDECFDEAYLETIRVAQFLQVVMKRCARPVDEAPPAKLSLSHLSLNCEVRLGKVQSLVYFWVDNFLGVFEPRPYKELKSART